MTPNISHGGPIGLLWSATIKYRISASHNPASTKHIRWSPRRKSISVGFFCPVLVNCPDPPLCVWASKKGRHQTSGARGENIRHVFSGDGGLPR
jgi:hypothetical protein